MNTKTILMLAAASIALAACGQSVHPGEVGVFVRQFGSKAGADPQPLPPGWHATGMGEDIVLYPVIERRYSYTREPNADGKENEELVFVDKNGLTMSGDMNIGVQVRRTAAPALYVKYRASLDQLLENQIRNDVRTAVARAGAKIPVEQMLGGGHQIIAQQAWSEVRNNWAKEGVDITRLEWSGALRFPESVTASILARAKADQQVLAASAQVAVAEAEAREKVAIATGDADATRIRGEALRTNPQVLEQQAISKWDGSVPQYVTSVGAVPFVGRNLK